MRSIVVMNNNNSDGIKKWIYDNIGNTYTE